MMVSVPTGSRRRGIGTTGGKVLLTQSAAIVALMFITVAETVDTLSRRGKNDAEGRVGLQENLSVAA
jgi:hypothetical protein